MSTLFEAFEAAQETIRTITQRPGNDEFLKLYALRLKIFFDLH